MIVISDIDQTIVDLNGRIDKGCATLKRLADQNNSIIFITGRPEHKREETTQWLEDNLSWFEATGENLIMRIEDQHTLSPKDYKHSAIQNLLDKIDTTEQLIFFEDDKECINLYSNYGIAFTAPDCWNILSIN